ncbi:MAG: dihydrofolate reductase [Eubacteriaceae bacterium]|nr:dihydrofolate reductase [Eubacteriaceae bacterium]
MIALVVAYDKNKAIGKDGKMPWNIPGELKRYRELTTGHTIIMGRKTYEAVGYPLPNRTNIVISSTLTHLDGCIIARSFDEAIRLAGDDDIFISGGAEVYRQSLDIVEKMYITIIDAEYEADTFFPDFDESLFDVEYSETYYEEEKYTYLTYTRK